MNPIFADLFLYVGALLPALLYPVVYLRSPWHRSVVGRDLMALSVVMAVVLALAAITAVVGPAFPFRQPLRIVVYVALTITLWHRLLVLVRVQRSRPNPGRRAGDR